MKNRQISVVKIETPGYIPLKWKLKLKEMEQIVDTVAALLRNTMLKWKQNDSRLSFSKTLEQPVNLNLNKQQKKYPNLTYQQREV